MFFFDIKMTTFNSIVSSFYAYLKQIWNDEKLIDVNNPEIIKLCAYVKYDFVNSIEIEPNIAKCEKLAIFKPERAEKVKKLSRLPIPKVKQSLIIPDEKGEPLTVDEMVQILDFTRFEAGRYHDTKLTDILTACGVDGIFANVPLAPRNFEKNETVPIFYDFTLESDIGIEPNIETCDCDKQPKSRFESRRPKVQKNKRYNRKLPKVKENYDYDFIIEHTVDDVVVVKDDNNDVINKLLNDRLILSCHPKVDILLDKFPHLSESYECNDDIETLRQTAIQNNEDLDEFFRVLNNEEKKDDKNTDSSDDEVPDSVIEKFHDIKWDNDTTDNVAPIKRVALNEDHPNYQIIFDNFQHLFIDYGWNEDDETLRTTAKNWNENLDEFLRLLYNEELPKEPEPEPEPETKIEPEPETKIEPEPKETMPSETQRDCLWTREFHATRESDEELLNFYREKCEERANLPNDPNDKFEKLHKTIQNLNLVLGHLTNPDYHFKADSYGLKNPKATLKSKLKIVNTYKEYTAEQLQSEPKAETEIKRLIKWLSCEHGFFPSFIVDAEEEQEFYKLLLRFINSGYTTDYKLHYATPACRRSCCGASYLRDIFAPTKKSWFKVDSICFYYAYMDIFKYREAFIVYDPINHKFINTDM